VDNDPRFSPDGHWVAWVTFDAFETGAAQVYASSFPVSTAKVRISNDGGGEPLWSRDGKSIMYRSGASILAARLTFTPSLQVVSRDTLLANSPFESFSLTEQMGPTDVGADGRILGLLPTKNRFQLVVVPDWRPELEKRVATSPSRH
jgi:hypothetical protein